MKNNLSKHGVSATSSKFDPVDEWVGMPDFQQDRIRPYAEIIVRFDDEESLQEFARLIGQKLTIKTKSIWHPQLHRGLNSKKRWVDEESISDIHSIEKSKS